jgi:hypothetical protein
MASVVAVASRDEHLPRRAIISWRVRLTWREIAGEAAPPTPVSAKSYTQAGLPWFELYDEHAPALDPTAALGGVKSIKELDDEPVPTPNVKRLWWKHQGTVAVDDGDW